MTNRIVQFDEPLGLYHGEVFRSPSDATSDDAARELERRIEAGLAALVAGSGDQVADIEPVPAAPVEVFRTYDVETGDLIVLWRVACRQRGFIQ